MNMPLVLTLAMSPVPIQGKELVDLIEEARAGLDNCRDSVPLLAKAPRKQVVAGKGGKANIVLVRLDYRLLHGQVVFSWVNSVAASRIIVVDNEAASDEIKKGALRLAKPAGVYLNVYTVERALSKMEKLNTLGENVMFVFGNVRELLQFVSSYPFPEVNFGAAANHDGAEPVGGKDSSVFLDAAEKADAQKTWTSASRSTSSRRLRRRVRISARSKQACIPEPWGLQRILLRGEGNGYVH